MVFNYEKSLEYGKNLTLQIVSILNGINNIANHINKLYSSINKNNFEESHIRILELLNELKDLFTKLIEIDIIAYEYFENSIKITYPKVFKDILDIYKLINSNIRTIEEKINSAIENISKINNIDSFDDANNWNEIYKLIIDNRGYEFEFTKLYKENILESTPEIKVDDEVNLLGDDVQVNQDDIVELEGEDSNENDNLDEIYKYCMNELTRIYHSTFANDIFKERMKIKLNEIKETDSIIAMNKLRDIIDIYLKHFYSEKSISKFNIIRKSKIKIYFNEIFNFMTQGNLKNKEYNIWKYFSSKFFKNSNKKINVLIKDLLEGN